MAADYEALEARVADLEQQARHVIPPKIDALAYGVSVLHEDVREIRRVQDDHGLRLDDLAGTLDRHTETLDRHTETLAGLAEGQRLHGGQLAALAEGQRKLQESVAEILRRVI